MQMGLRAWGMLAVAAGDAAATQRVPPADNGVVVVQLVNECAGVLACVLLLGCCATQFLPCCHQPVASTHSLGCSPSCASCTENREGKGTKGCCIGVCDRLCCHTHNVWCLRAMHRELLTWLDALWPCLNQQ